MKKSGKFDFSDLTGTNAIAGKAMPYQVYTTFLRSRLKEIQENKPNGKYSIAEFANDCGILPDEMYQILSKKRGAIVLLDKIARFLKCPPELLYKEIPRKSQQAAPEPLSGPDLQAQIEREKEKISTRTDRIFPEWNWPLITQNILQTQQGQRITILVCYYSDSEMGEIIKKIRNLHDGISPAENPDNRLEITFYLVDPQSAFSNVFQHELHDKRGYIHSTHILKHISWLFDLKNGDKKKDKGVKEKISLIIKLYSARGWANFFHFGNDLMLCSTPIPEITVSNAHMIECNSTDLRVNLLLGLTKIEGSAQEIDEEKFKKIIESIERQP